MVYASLGDAWESYIYSNNNLVNTRTTKFPMLFKQPDCMSVAINSQTKYHNQSRGNEHNQVKPPKSPEMRFELCAKASSLHSLNPFNLRAWRLHRIAGHASFSFCFPPRLLRQSSTSLFSPWLPKSDVVMNTKR